ncbi:hypothetical protein ACI50P_19580, partial [Escherichia coli]
SLKTSIKTITYLSDTGCLEIQGASLSAKMNITVSKSKKKTMKLFKRHGFSSRDLWLDEMIRTEKILPLYAKVKEILGR